MSALAPVDAASCRAMAVECAKSAGDLTRQGRYAEAILEVEAAAEWDVRASLLERANPHLPSGAAACSADTAGTETPPSVPADQFESEGPKSRPGDAAASLTQQSSSPRQERPSAKERSSDRSGGQFGDAPKPAHIPRTDGGADIVMTHQDIRT